MDRHPLNPQEESSSNNKRQKLNGDDNTDDFYGTTKKIIPSRTSSSSKRTSIAQAGKLEQLKQREAELSAMLEQVRRDKLKALQSRPLTIGIVGFGRFGQFIAKTFANSYFGRRVVVTSRSDYTELAKREMGAKYIPLSDPDAFLAEDLDVIVFAVSIVSFESTVKSFVPAIEKFITTTTTTATCSGNSTFGNGSTSPQRRRGPLIVDVLSVKGHARKILLDLLPIECDILCTHPMFGPDSGKNGWHGLNFVYEKTRIGKVLLEGEENSSTSMTLATAKTPIKANTSNGAHHQYHHHDIEGMDRMERFLSIWEEEGCRMVEMTCRDHDAYAANSQFITHLIGRVLGNQGLVATPIDTNGFRSLLQVVESTTADSFDLFYGLYKFNQLNSQSTIDKLQASMNDVVSKLKSMEEESSSSSSCKEEKKRTNDNEKVQEKKAKQEKNDETKQKLGDRICI